MPSGPDLPSFARALLEAIEASGLSRRDIATQAGRGCSEATLTNWTTGRGTPTPQAVFRLEEVLGLGSGALSHHLGFCPCEDREAPGVADAILADPSLSSEARSALLALYRVLSGERSS